MSTRLSNGRDEMKFINYSYVSYYISEMKKYFIFIFLDENMFWSRPKRDEILWDLIPIKKIIIFSR